MGHRTVMNGGFGAPWQALLLGMQGEQESCPVGVASACKGKQQLSCFLCELIRVGRTVMQGET